MPHNFFATTQARFVKHSFNTLLILLTLTTFSQFLSSVSPIYIAAASQQASKNQEAKDLKSEQDKQQDKEKNDKRYQEVEFDNSVNNCSNPIGFIEDTTKKEANSKYFWVPKNKDVPKNLTPTSNPEYFTKVVCSYANKVNYQENGVFKDIDNNLKEIDKKDSASKDYKFTNGGNDFKVYFSENPNKGFWFKNNQGVEIKVTKVSISSKDLNFDSKPGCEGAVSATGRHQADCKIKLEGSTITYSEVLPDIDLQYKVDNEGVSKYFVLKNKKALESDLSKIEFEIDTGNKKLVKKNETTAKITLDTNQKLTKKGGQDLDKKTKNNIELKISDIQAQIDSQTEFVNL